MWIEATLGDVTELQYGYTATAQEQPVGPKFLRITDIVPDSIDWHSVPYCQIDEPTFAKFALSKGDIVVARTGATAGYAKLIRGDTDAVFASYLIRIRPKTTDIDPEYLGRLIESTIFKQFVEQHKGGGAQPQANAPVLKTFKFRYPSLQEQSRIVSILSSYDNMIENNRRRIQLLQEAARLVYREWFVHLRFPGHENVLVHDGVPDGWIRLRLGDLVILNYGKGLKQEERIEGIYPVYGSSGIVGTNVRPLVKAPGIIVGRKGNVGTVYWSSRDYFPIDTVYYVDSTTASYFLFYTLRSIRFDNNDGAVPGLNRNYAYSRVILQPPPELVNKFTELAETIHRQIDTLSEQNEKLRQARDLLLARLMSGKIAV